MVSTFDEGKVAANYGQWIGGGDSLNGGKSTATLTIVSPGAAGSKGALDVTGEVVAGASMAYSGVFFFAGSTPGSPANLSGKKEIRFWAKGDGDSYTLAVLTQSRSGAGGEMPAMVSFTAGAEWKQYVFPFLTFETDGSDLSTLGFLRFGKVGKFHFQLDQVEIR